MIQFLMIPYETIQSAMKRNVKVYDTAWYDMLTYNMVRYLKKQYGM